jgi:hypothetical protein
MRRPTAALQRTAVAGIAGAGIALVGLSVSGFAGLDANLRAATERPAPMHRDLGFRYDGQPVRDCPRHRPGVGHQPT